VTVVIGREAVEITTFRVDGDYEDNRHPSRVAFTRRLEDDLSRRDFTVNAMAYRMGEGLIDLFGGKADLEKKLIRCVGNPTARFEEDGLRILRALRFASVLDFDVEEQTGESIHAEKHRLSGLSVERLYAEVIKLLCGDGASRVLSAYSDVIAGFLPEIAPSIGFSQRNPYHCYDVYTHTLKALAATPGDKILRLAVFFHDVGKPACHSKDGRGDHFYGHPKVSAELTRRALHRLRAEREQHDRQITPTEKSVRRLLSHVGIEQARRLLDVKRADNAGHAPQWQAERAAAIDEIETIIDKLEAEKACLSLSTLAVDGDDLRAIGVAPGPAMGEMLRSLLDRVLDGDLENDREALLSVARRMIDSY
jgi:tRNA nucleotidyltransferase (CCA-adding enzyme)